MNRLIATGPAQRDLTRLDDKVAVAIVEFMTGPLLDDPIRMSKPLNHPLKGLRIARRGAYRVLFRFDAENQTVSVMRIRHRSDAFRS